MQQDSLLLYILFLIKAKHKTDVPYNERHNPGDSQLVGDNAAGAPTRI